MSFYNWKRLAVEILALKFKNPDQMTHNELIQKLSSRDNKEVCQGLLSMVFYEADWKWAQDQCLCFLEHSDVEISGMAATCLGHIARIHRTLDRKLVETALSKHLKDQRISGLIQDTLDDIIIFIK